MTSHTTPLTSAVLLTLAASMAGCAWVPPPSTGPPGPVAYQQNRAEIFDPYPENDVGPAILGARPQSYERPIAEPSRARRLYHWQFPVLNGGY